jgi:hypothetical protein
MIVHHIALCTPCIVLFNCGHILHIRIDHTTLELEFQAEQVRWVFGGPQASSREDANIIVIKASPSAFNHYSLSFILNLTLCYSWLYIKFIGVVWHRSCNKINLLVYPC